MKATSARMFGAAGVAALLCLLSAGGCTKRSADGPAQAPSTATALSSGESAATESAGGGDSNLVPIECPLRKAGVNPEHLKPFEDVEKYVAFLERPDRAAWQKPDEVVRALHLTGDEVIADMGAGSGYFTFRFATALPRGKVVAIDIEPEMVRHIHHKAMSQSIHNVEAVLASADDPKVSATADIVFICDVLHHVADRRAWLQRVHDQMKADARLILIEFKEGDLPEGPPATVKISREQMLALARDVGFALMEEQKDLLPYQTFLVFRKGV